MDWVAFADVVRYYCVVLAALLIVSYGRVMWMRYRRDGWNADPHPVTMFGLILILGLSIIRRFDLIGEPGDIFLYGAAVAFTLLAVGLLIRFKVHSPVHVHVSPGKPYRK